MMNTYEIDREGVYTPQTIYTPMQVVGVQQLDIGAIMNLMLTMVIVFMLFSFIGKFMKGVGA